jgi:hypothetical protein
MAAAYAEIDHWHTSERPFVGGDKPDPQTLLWVYLHQHGIEDPARF